MCTKVNLSRLYSLLKKTEPIPEEYDVVWHGPFYVPRSRQWYPTHFLLYGGKLFCSLQIGWRDSTVVWEFATRRLVRDPSVLSSADADYVWEKAAPQLEKKLRSALENPSRFNKHVARWLPVQCRTGKIERHFTWPRGFAPMPKRRLDELEKALVVASQRPGIPDVTVRDYLKVAALAYDAAFPETRKLSPQDKHRRWADTRHGGMLDLPPEDAKAFDRWYRSREWSGSHPWEIVFAHPHGILLSPLPSESRSGGWRFYLSVDTEGLYVRAAKMALALSKAKIPFELFRGEEVLAALRGIDSVEVGPGFDQIPYDDLPAERPDAPGHIQWDPIPELGPISKQQRARVRHVEKTGSPAKFEGGKPD